MIFGIIGLGAVILVLLALLLRQRRTLAGVNELLTRQSDQFAHDLESKTAETDRLAEQLCDVQREIDQTLAANSELTETAATEAAEHLALREATEQETKGLVDRIAQLERVVHDNPRAPGQAETLWQLELGRSERTWRHSVATSPTADSPFMVTDDPLRLAVEIEAAALREEVGAFISVRWDAGQIEDPARAHLILRVAQELLAEASRNPEPLELVASTGAANEAGRCAVDFALVAPDDDGRSVVLEPPSLQSGVIDVSTTAGLVVSVR